MSLIIDIKENRRLPDAENSIREFVLKEPKTVVNMSIHDLADATFTSAATIVRFCKRFNLSGYMEFKIKLAAEIKSYSDYSINILDYTSISKDDSIEDVVDKITEISLSSIEETRTLLDKKTLLKVTKLILSSNFIDFYGIGASYLVASDAAYKFMRIGKMVSCFSLVDRQEVQAINSDENHVAIIVSYSGETKEMIRIAKILQEKGTPIISITSNKENQLINLTDYHFYVSSKETLLRNGAISSRTSSLFLIDVLYSMCCYLDYELSNEKLNQTRLFSNL